MQKAMRAVGLLIAVKANHRLGFVVGEVEPAFILERAAAELQELVAEPNDPDELADLFGILLHYAIKKGWSLDDIERRMLDKFRRRFQLPDGVDPGLFWAEVEK